MQSSDLKTARAMRDAFETAHERDAFASGYDHAHGIACHNVPSIGDRIDPNVYSMVLPDYVELGDTVTEDNIAEYHRLLCFAAEERSRCFSPWEFTAAEINSLDEFEAWDAWEAYEEGVRAAIEHDLAGYGY